MKNKAADVLACFTLMMNLLTLFTAAMTGKLLPSKPTPLWDIIEMVIFGVLSMAWLATRALTRRD